MIRTSDEFYEEISKLLPWGDIQSALALSRKGIRQFPGDCRLRWLEAKSLFYLGHYAAALAIFQELHRNAPEDWVKESAELDLVDTYLYRGKVPEAIQYGRAAMLRNQRDEGLMEHLSMVFYYHGIDRESARFADRWTRLNPKSARAWFNRGFPLYQLGDMKQAISCMESAVAIKRGDWCDRAEKFFAQQALGRFYFESERFQEAEEIWAKVPLKQFCDPTALIMWRSLLRPNDPRLSEMRRRWTKLRKDHEKCLSAILTPGAEYPSPLLRRDGVSNRITAAWSRPRRQKKAAPPSSV